MSITKIPPKPQEELPTLSTHEGSGDGRKEALVVDDDDDTDEEVVLMAMMRPARSIGRTKPPELHFDS